MRAHAKTDIGAIRRLYWPSSHCVRTSRAHSRGRFQLVKISTFGPAPQNARGFPVAGWRDCVSVTEQRYSEGLGLPMAKQSKKTSVRRCRALADQIAAALERDPELTNVSAGAEVQLYLEMAVALLTKRATRESRPDSDGKRRQGSVNQRRSSAD